MTTKTLSVSAIKNGSVIDHIPQGQAINIIQLLKLADKKNQMTVGLNLKSDRSGLKDLIKIQNRELSEADAANIAVLAPGATINIIKDYEVGKKIDVDLPDTILGVLSCPNLGCITHTEPVKSFFHLKKAKASITLLCKYCEKAFDRIEFKEYQA